MRLTRKLRAAAERYLDLQARRTHPSGDFDGAHRWEPTHLLECCRGIRSPSRAWPYSLLVHARTMVHVARDTGYDVTTLRAAVRRIEVAHSAALLNDQRAAVRRVEIAHSALLVTEAARALLERQSPHAS